jgi:chaperone BCS1
MNDLERGISVTKEGVRYYVQVAPHNTLPAGIFRMSSVRVDGDILPGFEPITPTNDIPLDVDNRVSEIASEMDLFLTRRAIFQKMGFSHKRGYLLHGPPGCGKSSALRLLEKAFVDRFNGIVLIWDNGSAVSAYYEHLKKQESSRPIMLVCEDLDSFVEDFEKSILEFLDGQVGLDNFVLVATTNNLERIPSRIRDRPSRIDRLVSIDTPTEGTRLRYLLQLGLAEPQARDLARRTDGLSIAQLKEIVVAVVCLGQELIPVLERLKVADMSPLSLPESDYGDWIKG